MSIQRWKSLRWKAFSVLAVATCGCIAYARTGSLGPCLSNSVDPILIGGFGALACGLAMIGVLVVPRDPIPPKRIE